MGRSCRGGSRVSIAMVQVELRERPVVPRSAIVRTVARRLSGALFVLMVVGPLLFLGGCAGGADSGGVNQSDGNAELSSADATEPAIAYEEETMHVSDVTVSGQEIAVIKTSKGTIKFEFYADDAPNTVASFVELADAGFYDGIKWHRVLPTFVVQGGDPQTRDLSSEQVAEMTARQAKGIVQPGEPYIGSGGPGWMQKAEINSHQHLKGTVAMARSQAMDSAGSQFYICLEPQPSLDGKYTVFGQVIEGMDVVGAIAVGDEIQSITIER